MKKKTAMRLALAYRASLLHFDELNAFNELLSEEDADKVGEAVKELVEKDMKRAGIEDASVNVEDLVKGVVPDYNFRNTDLLDEFTSYQFNSKARGRRNKP